MTAEEFSREFRHLMARAKSSGNFPVGQIVFELEAAKHQALHIQAAAEREMERQAATKAILPATIMPPRANGQRNHD